MTRVRRVPAARLWTRDISYSRAVRRGPLIEVSGTTATSESGTALYPGDAYEQSKHALAAIVGAIEQLGGAIEDVVRTRVFLTRIDDWRAAGRAHEEIFADIQPASSVVEVSGLLLPDLVVEIEATAYVPDTSEGDPS